MWNYFANKILRNRLAFIIVLGAVTVFMAYRASHIQLSYEFAKVLPVTDTAFNDYEVFKKMFGEDGSVMVIGLQDSNLFSSDIINEWYSLSNTIKSIDGVQDVLSVATWNWESFKLQYRFVFYLKPDEEGEKRKSIKFIC